MLVLGVLCLISFAAALPAPQSLEVIVPEEDLHTNVVELSPGKEELEILSPIPDPPELEQPGVLTVDSSEIDKNTGSEEKIGEQEEKEENKEPEAIDEIGSNNPEQIVVSVGGDTNKPSFINYYFPNLPNLSWPTLPSFQLPFNFSNFPSLSNIFGGRKIVHNSYRYVLV